MVAATQLVNKDQAASMGDANKDGADQIADHREDQPGENIYPCGKCQKNCATGIKCSDCKMWSHYKCTGMPTYALVTLTTSNRKFTCEACTKCNHEDYEELYDEIEKCKKEEQGKEEPKNVNQQTPDPKLPTEEETSVSQNLELRPRNAKTPTQANVDKGEAQEEEEVPKEVSQQTGGKIDKICYFFEKNKCRYGMRGNECKYQHPKPCPKFLKHGLDERMGCKLGRRCKDYHPWICKDSLSKKECVKMGQECKRWHLKGTSKIPREADSRQAAKTPEQARPSERSNQNKGNGTGTVGATNTQQAQDEEFPALRSRWNPWTPAPKPYESPRDQHFLEITMKLHSMIECLMERVEKQEKKQERGCCSHH